MGSAELSNGAGQVLAMLMVERSGGKAGAESNVGYPRPGRPEFGGSQRLNETAEISFPAI
jgi:hypothetical protein